MGTLNCLQLSCRPCLVLTYHSLMLLLSPARPLQLTWNIRDSHFLDTVQAIRQHLSRRRPADDPPRLVLWAHNSHLGGLTCNCLWPWWAGHCVCAPATLQHAPEVLLVVASRFCTPPTAPAAGDARATDMGQRRGEHNIGQLCREAFGMKKVYNIG